MLDHSQNHVSKLVGEYRFAHEWARRAHELGEYDIAECLFVAAKGYLDAILAISVGRPHPLDPSRFATSCRESDTVSSHTVCRDLCKETE